MPEQNYIEEITQIWEMVKLSFRDHLSETTTDLWFGEIQILAFQNETVTMGIPSQFKFEILKQKYLSQIEEKFSSFLGFAVHVDLRFTGIASASNSVSSNLVRTKEPEKQAIQADESGMPIFNFEYTFDNFIVGSTNKFAHAACVSVANKPATNYNPLFIYGNSGLGKTHLLCAIINQMKKNNPNVRIIYTKGEDFTNQMIQCLANKTMEDFRDKYRKADVLLIDDVQFIAGKVGTQEEFFHTFNALYEEKKQIILTSDRPPRDIKTLESRLQSRFEWGLLADIEPPDLELRIAIIKKKAEQVNIKIPNEVLTFLAENLRSNIRQMEGAIKKLGALAFLSGREITMEVARNCIAELLGGAEPVSITVEKIFEAVYQKYGVGKEDLISSKRQKEISFARHLTIYMIRELTEMSYPNIAKIFNRDHSTIMSSIETIHHRDLVDEEFSYELAEFRKEITGQ